MEHNISQLTMTLHTELDPHSEVHIEMADDRGNYGANGFNIQFSTGIGDAVVRFTLDEFMSLSRLIQHWADEFDHMKEAK